MLPVSYAAPFSFLLTKEGLQEQALASEEEDHPIVLMVSTLVSACVGGVWK